MLTCTNVFFFFLDGRILIFGEIDPYWKVLHCKGVPDRQGQELWWDGQSLKDVTLSDGEKVILAYEQWDEY